MGSAMAGIYGPILAVLTLVVLVMQIRLQRAQVLLQQATNKHAGDQAYLLNAKEDIDFYLEQLVKALAQFSGDHGNVKAKLHHLFARKATEELSDVWTKKDAHDFNTFVPQLQAIWTGMYTIFEGLASCQESAYRLHFSSAKMKTIAMLSYETCAALDNYLHCVTQGKLGYHYLFSTQLMPRSHGTSPSTSI
jgi:hypothetical protein